MSDTVVRIGPALAVAIVLLAIVAAVVARRGGTGHGSAVLRAGLRATAQLALLAVILGLVVHTLWASLLVLAVMCTVAAATASRRLRARGSPSDPRARDSHAESVRFAVRCLLPVAVGTAVLVTVLVIVRILPPSGLGIIPAGGIMLGGAMNTTSLAGRRAHDELRGRRGEVEAALSLGFSSFDARMEICRAAASTALVPALDQTRTVGLVTIPGAFVGMILGGAPPWEAAVMQLYVLISLLAVSATALVVTTDMVARSSL